MRSLLFSTLLYFIHLFFLARLLEECVKLSRQEVYQCDEGWVVGILLPKSYHFTLSDALIQSSRLT